MYTPIDHYVYLCMIMNVVFGCKCSRLCYDTKTLWMMIPMRWLWLQTVPSWWNMLIWEDVLVGSCSRAFPMPVTWLCSCVTTVYDGLSKFASSLPPTPAHCFSWWILLKLCPFWTDIITQLQVESRRLSESPARLRVEWMGWDVGSLVWMFFRVLPQGSLLYDSKNGYGCECLRFDFDCISLEILWWFAQNSMHGHCARMCKASNIQVRVPCKIKMQDINKITKIIALESTYFPINLLFGWQICHLDDLAFLPQAITRTSLQR